MREIYIFLGDSTARLRHELTSIWGVGVCWKWWLPFFDLLFYSEILCLSVWHGNIIFLLKQSWFFCLKLRWNWTDSLVIVRFAFASNETEDFCSLFSLHWVVLFCFFVYIQLRPHLNVVFLRQFNLFANLHFISLFKFYHFLDLLEYFFSLIFKEVYFQKDLYLLLRFGKHSFLLEFESLSKSWFCVVRLKVLE